MVAKKKLRRFDLNILLRLLTTIYESGHEKRTNLALKTRIHYDTCVSYLNMMEFLGFVTESKRHSYKVYDVTAHGISLCKKKLDAAGTQHYLYG